MKTELKITAMQLAFVAAIIAAAYFVAGCTSPKKVRDIELKGMYVNGYSEFSTLLVPTRKISNLCVFVEGESHAVSSS